MKIIKLLLCSIITIITASMLSACSTTSKEPATLSNGKVYWIDSEKCVNYKIEEDNTTITCYDKDQNFTEQIQPMSPEAIAIYNNNLMLQRAQAQAILQENIQNMQLNSARIQQQQQQLQLQQQQHDMMFLQSLKSQQQLYTPPRSVKCNTIGATIYCNEY